MKKIIQFLISKGTVTVTWRKGGQGWIHKLQGDGNETGCGAPEADRQDSKAGSKTVWRFRKITLNGDKYLSSEG